MAKYNYKAALGPFELLKGNIESYIESLSTTRASIQQMVNLGTNDFSGNYPDALKVFLMEVPVGAIEAMDLSIIQYRTEYNALLTLAKSTIDEDEDTNINTEGLEAYQKYSSSRSSLIQSKSSALNQLLSDLDCLGISITRVDHSTSDDVNDKMTSEVSRLNAGMDTLNSTACRISDSASSLEQYFGNVRMFIQYLKTCVDTSTHKINYPEGNRLQDQTWYPDYAKQATATLATLSDDYFNGKEDLTNLSLIERQRLAQIMLEISESQNTERLKNLFVDSDGLIDQDKVRQIAAQLFAEVSSMLSKGITGDDFTELLEITFLFIAVATNKFDVLKLGGEDIEGFNNGFTVGFDSNGNMYFQHAQLHIVAGYTGQDIGNYLNNQEYEHKAAGLNPFSKAMNYGLSFTFAGDIASLYEFMHEMSTGNELSYAELKAYAGAYDYYGTYTVALFDPAFGTAKVYYIVTDQTQTTLDIVNEINGTNYTIDEFSAKGGLEHLHTAYNTAVDKINAKLNPMDRAKAEKILEDRIAGN